VLDILGLFMPLLRYGRAIEPSLEPELLQALDMIVFDIGTSGAPDCKLPWGTYQWDWTYLVLLGPSSSTREPIWLTRSQAAEVADYIAGLTLLYGPRALLSCVIEDRAQDEHSNVTLYFRLESK